MTSQPSPAGRDTSVYDVSDPQVLQTAAASCTAARHIKQQLLLISEMTICCSEQNASISSHQIKTFRFNGDTKYKTGYVAAAAVTEISG